ncbi:CaiB/BaiF CoA transferase family protein [Lachnotalea sp. AF33-28]|uniref:CaiB/BaiF CoA transferase family protein n=1 Tax=Lachnotalea sp. AF33-28 TaxID=2292046 RepID=UPI000E4E75CC|nr:CaiB/BaiF CoA-transferase family protein [Lachnotalea sp. AF33-28]RHP31475.1 CoA transferase [Lachnotalea sp. AF33-28]
MNKPLEGIRVVECAFFVAAPSAGLNLADWGAEVIKVEPIYGEPGHRRDADGRIMTRDEYFNVYNRKKKGIALNTKDPRGMEMLYRLLEDADVFLTSYRPGALVKMGLNWEVLHEKFPKLIYAAITGFGDEGPEKDAPGFDTVAYWARSGLMQDVINRGNDVLIPPVAFGDLTCGAALAGAVGTALFNRERTGRAEKVTLSLYGLSLYSLSYMVFDVQTGGNYPASRLEPALPMMASFKCKDGKWFYMANVDHEKHYADLMRMLGREDLVEDERFKSRTAAQENREEFIRMLDAEFARYTRDEVLDILKRADIAHSTINHVADNLCDPQAKANDYLKIMHMRDGVDVYVPSTPVRFGTSDMEEAGMGPLLGEDTLSVLTAAGYTAEELNHLAKENVIVGRQV